jgi:hypothetical protein
MLALAEIDWADEALAEGWPAERIEALAESAARLRALPTFIHRDAIVLEREPIREPYAAPGAQFVEPREQGTLRGTRLAREAMDAIGMPRAADAGWERAA